MEVSKPFADIRVVMLIKHRDNFYGGKFLTPATVARTKNLLCCVIPVGSVDLQHALYCTQSGWIIFPIITILSENRRK
jgi:hypothetical protein